MTKPANFPERKRQRRLRALNSLLGRPFTTERAEEIEVLVKRTKDNLRDMKTKKVSANRRRVVA